MISDILDRMRSMKLVAMSRAFKTCVENNVHHDLTHDELVAMLVDAEWDDRQNRSVERQLRNARFRYKSSVDSLSFEGERKSDKATILRLTECTFIDKHENVLITGSTGVGKSFIASAIGHEACLKGYRVQYHNTAKLFGKLKMAKGDGSYVKEVARLERQHLLILDDFGLQPFDQQSRAALMEIIEDRHGKGATMITSQIPVSLWHDVIGEKTVADAVLDRIIYESHRLELKGESLRKRTKTEQDELYN